MSNTLRVVHGDIITDKHIDGDGWKTYLEKGEDEKREGGEMLTVEFEQERCGIPCASPTRHPPKLQVGSS